MGRVASTLQRFSADDVQFAHISFQSSNLHTATYRVDLEKITKEQFHPNLKMEIDPSIIAVDIDAPQPEKKNQRFTWGLGPYTEHRLFNPDLPLSVETGIEVEVGYQITDGLKIKCIAQVSVDKSNQKRKTVEFCFTTRSLRLAPL